MPKLSFGKSFSRKLLKAIAISGAVLIAASNPYFGLRLVRGIRKDLERKKWRQFYNSLHQLRRQKRINISQNKDGSYRVELTGLGWKIVEKTDLDNIRIKKPAQWDGYWRFFSFDIPTKKKLARQSLLNKLKELGFIMVQKSLWAHPFECQKELAVIAKVFEVEPYVCFLVAHRVGKEGKLEYEFTRKNHILLG